MADIRDPSVISTLCKYNFLFFLFFTGFQSDDHIACVWLVLTVPGNYIHILGIWPLEETTYICLG